MEPLRNDDEDEDELVVEVVSSRPVPSGSEPQKVTCNRLCQTHHLPPSLVGSEQYTSAADRDVS